MNGARRRLLTVAESAIDERITELVAARRQTLAELVRAAVDRELQALVEAELEQRRNGRTDLILPGRNKSDGNGHVRPAAAATDSMAVKVCTGPCGRTLPVSAFERNRGKCRECRRAEHRDRELRARPADPEPPRTG
jgi:hypothetical protein